MSPKIKAFLYGAGSIMNLGGRPIGRKRFGDASTDAKALQSDWIAVGNDIRKAFHSVTGKNMPVHGSDYSTRKSPLTK